MMLFGLVICFCLQLSGHALSFGAVETKFNRKKELGLSTDFPMCVIPSDKQKSFTYADRPFGNYVDRWAAIQAELRKWQSSRQGFFFHRSYFSVIDLGSNFGFFSVQTAGVFPEALVIGVEGSTGIGNEDLTQSGKQSGKSQDGSIAQTAAIKSHIQWIEKLDLKNNVIAPEVWDYNRVVELSKSGFAVDVMYLFSMFHHMDRYCFNSGQYSHSEPNADDTVDLMAKILSLANLHFIELAGLDVDMKHLVKPFNNSEGRFLEAAMQRSGRSKSIIELGQFQYRNRKIFLVKDATDVRTVGVKETLTNFKTVLPYRINDIPANKPPACK